MFRRSPRSLRAGAEETQAAEPAGKSMQRGSGRRAIKAAPAGSNRRCGGIAALLLGLALSACANGGHIGNLSEGGRAAVAIESVDGAPAAVVHKFVDMLKDEAAARHIAIARPGEADYRLRAYLAAKGADGATSISWAIDVYGADQHRAIRLNGEEEAAGRAWKAADDGALRRIARAGMERLVLFLAAARPPSAPAFLASPPSQRAASRSGGLDDWAPEAAGIFRILRGEPARTEVAADTTAPLQPDEVPLPRRRPARADDGARAPFAVVRVAN
jgi:hypothetical protein